MGAYGKGPEAHPSYGSMDLNGQLHPVWEAAGVFQSALGPIIRSNGYPAPATLPAGIGGGAMGYSSSGGAPSLNGRLLLILLAVSVVGLVIVHHLHWRA